MCNELFAIKSTFNAVNDSGEIKVDGNIDSSCNFNAEQKEKLSLATQDLFAARYLGKILKRYQID